jgi:beta-lactamase class A
MRQARFTRRVAVVAGLAAAAPWASAEPSGHRDGGFAQRVKAIEARIGGRVGVAALNTANAATLSYRGDQRFAMCSMFKWLLAAQMLQMNEHAPGLLDRRLRYDAGFLAPLGHAPATTANLSRGWMTVAELAEAAVTQSDNGAANLLLELAMGPEGFTRFVRASGDTATRLDRVEMALNENLPGDRRDTTTPDAMAHTMARVLTTDAVLNVASRDQLIGWLVANQTGAARLRAGLPRSWRAGDKTGTGGEAHNATTDVAICWPGGPDERAPPPIVIACFLSDSAADPDARNAAQAEIARVVAQTWSR